MAFGKRGTQQALVAQPRFAVASPVAAEMVDEPDMKRGLFGGDTGDDFDINLGFMQPYGDGKSMVVLILLWLFLGGAGAHRYYLGHNTLGTSMLLANVFCTLSAVIALITGVLSGSKSDVGSQPMWSWWFGVFAMLGLWYLIDGIYVICRTLSASVRN